MQKFSNFYKPHLAHFILYVLLLLFLLVGIVFVFSRNATTSEKQKTAMKEYTREPKMEINPGKQYTATVQTSKGTFQIELFSSEVPKTVNNFVFLAKAGFYDKTPFHRVVKDFMIQGGDPTGNGSGGPGYTFADEKITRDYKRGIVAMANRGPNTNGSQFFIMHKDTDLPKNYVIFGMVREGMDTIDAIAKTPTIDNGHGEQSKPTENIVVNTISIAEKK